MEFRSQQCVRIIPENWYGTIVGDENPLIINDEYCIILFPEFSKENDGKILISVSSARIRNQYEN